MTIIGQGRAHCLTVSLHHFIGHVVSVVLTFERSHSSHLFLQLFLGMAICIIDLLRGFFEIVKMAESVCDLWKHGGYGFTNRVLSIAHDPSYRHK
jgi:hypothetical protein